MKRIIFIFIACVFTLNVYGQKSKKSLRIPQVLITNTSMFFDGLKDSINREEFTIIVDENKIFFRTWEGLTLNQYDLIDTLEVTKNSKELLYRMTTSNPDITIRFLYQKNKLKTIGISTDYDFGIYYYYDPEYVSK